MRHYSAGLSALMTSCLVAACAASALPGYAQSSPADAPAPAAAPIAATAPAAAPLGPTAYPMLPTAPEAPPVNGTAANVPTFDMAQTIHLALASSTELAVAKKTLDRAAAEVDRSAAAGRPTVNSQDTYQHLDTPVVIAFGSQSITAETQDKEFLTANASLPIDVSGKIRAATQAAELQELQDKFDLDRIANARVLQAQSTYFDLLEAEHQVDVEQSALQNAQAQEDIAHRQFEGGVGQKIDFLRAQSQVATAQQNLLAAQDNLSNQRIVFNDLIGRPLDGVVQAVDTAGVTTGATVAADAANPSDVLTSVPTFYMPNLPAPEPLDQAVKTALLARPELRIDQVAVQAAQKQVAIARDSLYPTLSVNATGDYYPVTDFETPRHSLGVYTVNLNIPLYDGGVARDEEREARDTAQSAQLTYGSDRTTVEMQVREAYSNLQTASQEITAANAALRQAIAARQLAGVRYAGGVGLYLEVTDAESALTQAETSQVNAVYGYLTARARYQNAIGTPQIGSGT